jgi:hypothetical protein
VRMAAKCWRKCGQYVVLPFLSGKLDN